MLSCRIRKSFDFKVRDEIRLIVVMLELWKILALVANVLQNLIHVLHTRGQGFTENGVL